MITLIFTNHKVRFLIVVFLKALLQKRLIIVFVYSSFELG